MNSNRRYCRISGPSDPGRGRTKAGASVPADYTAPVSRRNLGLGLFCFALFLGVATRLRAMAPVVRKTLPVAIPAGYLDRMGDNKCRAKEREHVYRRER